MTLPRAKRPYEFIQVFTCRVPFSDVLAAAAIAAITTGDRPERPTHPSLTDHLWALAQQCWGDEPQERPRMDKVIKQLSVVSRIG